MTVIANWGQKLLNCHVLFHNMGEKTAKQMENFLLHCFLVLLTAAFMENLDVMSAQDLQEKDKAF